MVVCLCRAVCDRAIRAAVLAGARTSEDVTAACGAGADCRGCVGAVDLLVDEVLDAAAVRPYAGLAVQPTACGGSHERPRAGHHLTQ
jgi:bacterioferritin-associated ferredoxin